MRRIINPRVVLGTAPKRSPSRRKNTGFVAAWAATAASALSCPPARRVVAGAVPGRCPPRPLAANKFSNDVYDPEELRALLDVHDDIRGQTDTAEEGGDARAPGSGAPPDWEGLRPTDDILSLHDLVVAAATGSPLPAPPQPMGDLFGSEGDAGPSGDSGGDGTVLIRAIASDVDGTILRRDQSIHKRTRGAIVEALSATNSEGRPIMFFPATGKSRAGCLGSLGEIGDALRSLETPGVFQQGLVVHDGRRVIYERKLPEGSVARLEELVGDKAALVGYDGDDLMTTSDAPIVHHLSSHYGEPLPRLLQGTLAAHNNGLHKVLILDDDVDMLARELRPVLEEAAAACGATITQALPTMLEWLPAGCSKATGVSELCKHLGIDPTTELLAIGDAENDVGMLEMAAVGVAVANACPLARSSANFVTQETNDSGGMGEAIERFGGLY